MKWFDIIGVSIALALTVAIYLSPSSNVEVYTVPITCNDSKCVAQVNVGAILFDADSLFVTKQRIRYELYQHGRHVRFEVTYGP
jgi:hypothetical protein